MKYQMTNKTEVSKFSYAEALSNSNGKTSGSKLNGDKIVTVGCISFILCTAALFFKITDALAFGALSAGVIATGAGLLGYSKKHATQDTTNTIDIDKQE